MGFENWCLFSPRNQPKFGVAFRTCLMLRFVYSFLFFFCISFINYSNNIIHHLTNLKEEKRYKQITILLHNDR